MPLPPPPARHDLTPGSLQDRLAELEAAVAWLEQRQDGLAGDLRDAIQHVRYTLDALQAGMLDHVTGDAQSNAVRDARLCEHEASLASAAGRAGGKAGATWGAIVAALAALVTAFAPAVAKIIQSVLEP